MLAHCMSYLISNDITIGNLTINKILVSKDGQLKVNVVDLLLKASLARSNNNLVFDDFSTAPELR